MSKTNEPKMASRLARAIASDLSIYNKDKIQQGLENDNVLELIDDELEEGRSLFRNKVSEDLVNNTNIFERAIVDVIFASRRSAKAKIF